MKKENDNLFLKIKQFYSNHKLLIIILIISLILRILHLSKDYSFWWDSYIYLGMGKYIFSLGSSGIWESFRPLVWPTILGTIWKLNLPLVWIAKFLDILLSLTAIILTYSITKKLFDKNTALLASFILGTFPLFIMYSGLGLTEPLTLTLSLLSIYFFIEKKYKLTGLFIGLSFLTKFPAGILLPSIILTILISNNKRTTENNIINNMIKNKLTKIKKITIPFIIIITPYLILNYFLYQNPFEPFISGSWIVNTEAWQYNTGTLFYFQEFFQDNKILIISYLAFILFVTKKEWKKENKLLIYLPVIISLIYFLFFVSRKEIRYMTLILPFVAIIVSSLIIKVYNYLKKTPKAIIKPTPFIIFTILMIIFSQADVYDSIIYQSEENQIGKLNETYLNIFIDEIKNNYDDSAIFSSNPKLITKIDNKIIPTGAINEAKDIYYWQKENFELIFINSCDYYCQETDMQCKEDKNNFLTVINNENILIEELDYIIERKKKDKILSYENCKIYLFEKVD